MKQIVKPGGTIDAVTQEELTIALAEKRANVVLGLGGGMTERLDDDSPMRGTVRQITSFRRGGGSDNFVCPANQVVSLCKQNPRRICGNLQNIGANPVFVYCALVTDIVQGNASVLVAGYLVQYGSWDFKLTNDAWCGPVSLFSTLGTTVVWGEH